MNKFYPCSIPPIPVACWSVDRLADNLAPEFVPMVVNKLNGASLAIPFAGDHLDAAALASFLAGEPYGKIVFVNNQVFSPITNLQTAAGVEPPRIHPDIKIGTSAAMLFEGGTRSGTLFGLDMIPALGGMGLSDGNYTVMAVLRPTTSRYLNQANAPGLGDEGGTILSMEAGAPIHATGATATGSAVILNVSPFAGIEPLMWVTGSPFPFPVPVVSVISPTGPTTADITLFGTQAVETNAAAQLTFTSPIVRCYQLGDESPGSFAMNSNLIVQDIALEPQDFSGVEIRPVVAAWVSTTVSDKDVPGYKVWQNEIVRSAPLASARGNLITHGYLGRMGGSKFGARSRCGDFWLAALLIWDVALSQAQRAIVADALYERFAIEPRRSIRSAKSVTVMGDSIAMDYVTLGNYGWSKRLADMLDADVRVLNYAIPGSQITQGPGLQPYNSTEGLFEISVAAHADYSKTKNVLILLGGGNDMENNVSFKATINVATNEITAYKTAATSASAAAGTLVLNFPAGALPFDLTVGAFVENLTAPASIPAGRTVVAITATSVTWSGAIAAPGVGNGDTIKFRYHNMVVGNRLYFLSLPPLVTGIATATIYYVKTVIAADRYTIAATPTGAIIDIGGTFIGEADLIQYTKSAAGIFGTPTTHGLQKIVADAAAASPGIKIYICTVLPRTGSQYDFVIEELNTLIMGGGAGGYQALDTNNLPAFADHDVPPDHQGAAFFDAGHLNEIGSQAMADFLFPIIDGYLNS